MTRRSYSSTSLPDGLFPGDAEWNRLMQKNSLIPSWQKNRHGFLITTHSRPEFGNPEHVKYLQLREAQINGLEHAFDEGEYFFECVRPGCRQVMFKDWHEEVKCKCNYRYEFDGMGMKRII